ncbi:MAG: N-acetyltransferase [Rhizobiales bacterium]|nr:N-acetyltransferase [Hyphomicrobiales bacterium]
MINIRHAVEADFAAVTAIYADAVLTGTASYELEPPGLDEMLRRWRALGEQGYPYRVAERDHTITGYAYAGPYRPRPAYRFTAENAVYVAADARRGGVGRALLEQIISDCGQAGFRQMIAVIGDGSTHAASVGLHEALGFRLIGTIEGSGYKHQRWLDTVLMQRQLGAGNATAPDEISR